MITLGNIEDYDIYRVNDSMDIKDGFVLYHVAHRVPLDLANDEVLKFCATNDEIADKLLAVNINVRGIWKFRNLRVEVSEKALGYKVERDLAPREMNIISEYIKANYDADLNPKPQITLDTKI